MRNCHGPVFFLAVAIAILITPQPVWMEKPQTAVRPIEKNHRKESGSHADSLWNRYQKINPDLKAVLVFENGLLSLPVVQAEDNTAYLRKGFDGTYDRKGTPFLDCHDSLDDPAFLIYGHNVYYDASGMFSPLMKLETQSGYEENHAFRLVTATESRKYEIVSVFHITVRPSVFDQRKSDFLNQKDYEDWITYACCHNEIRPLEEPAYGDTFCLLQTCVRGNENERLIVLAAESTDE